MTQRQGVVATKGNGSVRSARNSSEDPISLSHHPRSSFSKIISSLLSDRFKGWRPHNCSICGKHKGDLSHWGFCCLPKLLRKRRPSTDVETKMPGGQLAFYIFRHDQDQSSQKTGKSDDRDNYIEAILTNDELEIVLSTFRFLKIRRCILSSEISGKTTRDNIEKLNEGFILTGFVGVEFLGEYVKASKPPNAQTAVVIKTNMSSRVKHVFIENSEKLFWFVWLLITDEDLDSEIRIPYNCQLFHIKRGVRGAYRLIENYHIKNSSNFRKEFGFWTPQNGLIASSLPIYSRRTDMNGVHLSITLCKKYAIEDLMLAFWNDLARTLNFSLKTELQALKKTPNGYIPLQNPDSSTCLWGITGLDFEKNWLFSKFGEKVKLTMKFRGTNEVGWRAYVQPFTRDMWLAVGVWLLLSTVAIVVIRGCTRETLYHNVFTSFYCLCNSDPMTVLPPNEPLPPKSKLVYLMVLTVPAVIVPAYSAYILSTLSIIRPLEPFNDFKGFIQDGTYTLTAVNNTFAIRYLRGSRDPEIKYIYDNLFIGAEQAAPSFPALFEQLCRNNKLVGLFVDLKLLRREFRCRMYIVHQEVITISTGYLLSKGSPLKRVLNERLLQYQERGAKRMEKLATDDPKSLQKVSEELHALNMSQMRAIFFLLLLGVILSLIVLAAEIAMKKYWKYT